VRPELEAGHLADAMLRTAKIPRPPAASFIVRSAVIRPSTASRPSIGTRNMWGCTMLQMSKPGGKSTTTRSQAGTEDGIVLGENISSTVSL